ncbi:MAG: DUF975 family protein [Ruminococcaceae bacterium]|nr:DUF975 family protein [Oscillospiraceae bacterium]
MNRAELKSLAKQHIKGNIGMLFVVTLIIAVVASIASLILNLIPVVGSIAAAVIVTPAFTLSLARVYLNLNVGQKPVASDAFLGFDDFWSAFKVTFLTGLFTFLWSLLFVIPGIVKSYAYSMSINILAENKEKAALACIDESKKMTNGYKMDLFVLDLSFIGWSILMPITFGIAAIWVVPYMEATYINAYKWLKSKQIITGETVTAPVEEAPAAPAPIEEAAVEEPAPTVEVVEEQALVEEVTDENTEDNAAE